MSGSRRYRKLPVTVIVGVWWIACLLWSAGWLFLKIGLGDLPPIAFAALRLALALSVLVLVSAAVVLRRI